MPWHSLLQRLSGSGGSVKGAKRYASNTLWLFADRGVQMVLAIVIGAILARYLGPERYGIYSYALSYAIIFSAFANLGLGQVIVKEFVSGASEGKLLGTTTSMRLIGSLVAIAGLWIATSFTESDSFVKWAVMLAGIPLIFRSAQTLIFFFQARVKSSLQVKAHLFSLIATSLLKLIFVWQQRPLSWFLIVISVDAILYSAALLYVYGRNGGRLIKWKFNPSYGRHLLQMSWPLIFALIIITFYMQIDQLMIKHILGNSATGYYAAAVKLSSAWYAFPWLLTGSVFPALLRAQQSDQDLFRTRINGVYTLLIYLAILLVLPTWLLASPVIHFIFGDAYSAAAPVLVIHIAASLFVFMGYAGDKWLLGAGMQKYTAINTLAGALLNVAINLWFIPKYGIRGAAWATLISQSVSYHFMLIVWPETRPIFWAQSRAFIRCISLQPLLNRTWNSANKCRN